MAPIATTTQLPALVKANNYTFYTLDNGEYDLRKMYKEWRSRLSHYEVPRLCRLDRGGGGDNHPGHSRHHHQQHPQPQQTSRLPALLEATGGCSRHNHRTDVGGPVNQPIKHRIAQHSASSPSAEDRRNPVPALANNNRKAAAPPQTNRGGQAPHPGCTVLQANSKMPAGKR